MLLGRVTYEGFAEAWSGRTAEDDPGADFMTSASGTLVRSLLRHGLTDELRLLIYPVVVGSGKRLCEGDDGNIPLNLTHSDSFDNGMNYVVYTTA